jgi:hypothetical protein
MPRTPHEEQHVLPRIRLRWAGATTRITGDLSAQDRVVSDLSVDIPEGTPLKVVQ